MNTEEKRVEDARTTYVLELIANCSRSSSVDFIRQNLQKDLQQFHNLDGINVLEVVLDLEDHFGIEISDESLSGLKTPLDFINLLVKVDNE